jgi:hypothetical protein
MIWGAIWIGGRSDIVFMKRDLKSPRQGYSGWSYLQVLKDQVPRIYQPGMRWQQDNAPIHTCEEVLTWLEDEGIDRIEWPPNSPDLSPIEHVWRILKDRLNKNCPWLRVMGKSKAAYRAFIQAIVTEWEDIDQDLIDNLIKSMDSRVNTVLEAKGWHTRY